jgi:DNA-binding transcriptional ArsR family regulator
MYERVLMNARTRGKSPRAVRDDACDAPCVDEVKVVRARAAMKSLDTLAALAETFKVLGDTTRVRIAWALSREELCVCDISALLGMSQSAVSHSLRALRDLRLVRYRKEGRIAYYALDDEHIAELLHQGIQHVEEAA